MPLPQRQPRSGIDLPLLLAVLVLVLASALTYETALTDRSGSGDLAIATATAVPALLCALVVAAGSAIGRSERRIVADCPRGDLRSQAHGTTCALLVARVQTPSLIRLQRLLI